MEKTTIVNCKYKTYLIGSMEDPAKKDEGKGWRDRLEPELLLRGVYAFNPTREEIKKVGMPTDELMEKLSGWQLSGNWELFLEYMRRIWRGVSYFEIDKESGATQDVRILGDVDYVEHSDFLIMNLEEGDKPGGTIAELVIAWYRGIPVYLITPIPKSKINKSILYFILDSGHGQGMIFKAQSELITFLDGKYNLKKEIKNA